MAVRSPIAPKDEDQESIKALLEALQRTPEGTAQITIDGKPSEKLTVPHPVFEILRQVAEVMARGGAISIVPVGMKLTTQQAAEILGVSRPYLVGLVDKGEIPHEMVGTHRRIRFDDLMAFKQSREAQRSAVLRRLSEQAERLKLDY